VHVCHQRVVLTIGGGATPTRQLESDWQISKQG